MQYSQRVAKLIRKFYAETPMEFERQIVTSIYWNVKTKNYDLVVSEMCNVVTREYLQRRVNIILQKVEEAMTMKKIARICCVKGCHELLGCIRGFTKKIHRDCKQCNLKKCWISDHVGFLDTSKNHDQLNTKFSHGYCDPCAQKMLSSIDRRKTKGENLNRRKTDERIIRIHKLME